MATKANHGPYAEWHKLLDERDVLRAALRQAMEAIDVCLEAWVAWGFHKDPDLPTMTARARQAQIAAGAALGEDGD